MSRFVEALKVLHYEQGCLKDSLARARRRGDDQAERLGKRHEGADRITAWYEFRLERIEAAIRTVEVAA